LNLISFHYPYHHDIIAIFLKGIDFYRNKQMRAKLLKPLFTSLILYSIAGIFKAVIIIAKANDLNFPQLFRIGEKSLTLFFTLGTVILLRWLIADAPFSMLRRYTIAPLLKSIITFLIYFGAALVLLNRLFGINLTPLLTTSAVLTGILALSLQEILKNFFTGLWINTERVVAKGDWVRIANVEGEVLEVTWNTTRVMTRKNDLIYIPNRLLIEGPTENYTYPSSLHAVEVDIGASYFDPPNKVKNVLIELAKDLPHVMTEPKAEAWITNYGDFSINYRIRAWVNDFRLVPYVKTEINSRIWYAFRRNNVEIPFPMRVNYARQEKKHFETEIIMNSLKDIEFLSPINYDELRNIAAYSSFETFGTGETIVKQGDTGDTFYLIHSGIVDVLYKDSAGNEKPLATLKQGEFFGEMSLLAGEPRKATVIAHDDTSCIVVSSKGFKSAFIKNPNLAESLSELLAKRSDELEKIKNLAVSEREKLETEISLKKNILNKIKNFFKVG